MPKWSSYLTRFVLLLILCLSSLHTSRAFFWEQEAARLEVGAATVHSYRSSATTYANVLVVKEGNENADKIVALKNALLSDAVKTYINNTYSGAVVPIF